MRELVFALEYAPGTNAVADILADNPETKIRSLSCHVSPKNLWRVDYVSGRETALDNIAETVTDAEYYTDCLARRDCEADWETQVLDRTDDALVLYSYWSRTPSCTSIPHLALDHFGDGLIFKTTWVGRRYEWRIIAPTTPPTTHSATQSRARSTTRPALHLSVSATRMTPPRTTVPHIDGRTGCSGTGCRRPRVLQDTARDRNLRTRRETRYPRLDALYRLRRAEAHLAEAYVADRSTSPHLSSPDT